MKGYFFIFLFMFLISGSSIVSAISFSPGILEFNLNVGEESCQTIFVESDSETFLIKDLWAENTEVEWKISLFEKDSEYHNLILDYGNLSEDGLLEVCLVGESSGEYHGVLLLTGEQQGNSILQIGIWLKAIIEEEENPVSPPPIPSSSGSGPNTKKDITAVEENSTTDFIENGESEKVEEVDELIGDPGPMTGSSITGLGKGSILVSIFIVVIVIGFGIFMRKKR